LTSAAVSTTRRRLEAWHEPRQLDFQHLSVQEQHRGQRLALGGRRYPPIDGQMCQKCRDVVASEIAWMTLAMKQDEAANPEQVLLLRPIAVVLGSQAIPHLVEKTRFRFHAAFVPRFIDV
jgi:hypothetical protein